MKNSRVVAVVYDDLCAFELGVASELFGLTRPEFGQDWYEFEVVSIDEGPLRAPGGLTFSAPTDLSVLEAAGTIVLPGWRDPAEMPPSQLIDALRRANARGTRILSICSGVFILAATGLLDGKQATTHWRYTDQLRQVYPSVDVQPDVLYVDNGLTLTSAGSAAGLDLGLHLIRRDFGAEAANSVARRLVVPPQRSGGQAQFISAPAPDLEQGSVSSTARWALQHLDTPLTVADLAANATMSPRTFARRFRHEMGIPPHQWLIRQRVALAQRMLESTGASIEIVAAQSGFGSTANLRHHFGIETQVTPSAYRASFTTVENLNGQKSVQLTQVVDHGRTSRRASPIGSEQTSQAP